MCKLLLRMSFFEQDKYEIYAMESATVPCDLITLVIPDPASLHYNSMTYAVTEFTLFFFSSSPTTDVPSRKKNSTPNNRDH